MATNTIQQAQGKPPQVQSAPQNKNGRPTKRQYVRYAFYKVDPSWRRLPPEKQAAQKRELVETIESFNRTMLLRPYTLMGTRADAEILLWQIAESIEPLQELATAIMSTQMGGYLSIVYSYLSQTKRSVYEIRDDPNAEHEQLIISPTEAKYLFVYPFIKTRPWYRMTKPARQGIMDEHIQVGRKYPSIKLNTTYCFGIDDYEFVVAFETDEPADFLDLVQELRETEASLYTLQDTPLFTCTKMSLAETLDSIGGPKIAEPKTEEEEEAFFEQAIAVDELPEGTTKVVFIQGKQIGLFNINGDILAVGNRCPHARGPLTEGDIHADDCTVTCPWHYAKFDLKTGHVVDGVASTGVESYRTEVRDGMIYVGTKE